MNQAAAVRATCGSRPGSTGPAQEKRRKGRADRSMTRVRSSSGWAPVSSAV